MPSTTPPPKPSARTAGRRRAPRAGERLRDADRTRGDLLRAAFDEFAARGFAGARVHDIATRAGVDKQLINYYFDGKSGLYQEVLRAQFARDATVNDPDQPLADNAARYVQHALADSRLTRLLLWAGLSQDPDHPATLPAGSLDLSGITQRQERGELDRDLDPASVLLIIIGAVTAAVALPHVVRTLFDLDPDSPEFEDHYAHQLKAVVARLGQEDEQPVARRSGR
ncbi:MAG: TetR/AcrR family transcriptional regulator [Frankia sp.]